VFSHGRFNSLGEILPTGPFRQNLKPGNGRRIGAIRQALSARQPFNLSLVRSPAFAVAPLPLGFSELLAPMLELDPQKSHTPSLKPNVALREGAITGFEIGISPHVGFPIPAKMIAQKPRCAVFERPSAGHYNAFPFGILVELAHEMAHGAGSASPFPHPDCRSVAKSNGLRVRCALPKPCVRRCSHCSTASR
jgi:hypothetical protein